MLAVHNLAGRSVTVDLGPQPEQQACTPIEVYSSSGPDERLDKRLRALELAPYGYRWIRLR
jgi:hypothetical protein